jgi:hypothetical protein
MTHPISRGTILVNVDILFAKRRLEIAGYTVITESLDVRKCRVQSPGLGMFGQALPAH